MKKNYSVLLSSFITLIGCFYMPSFAMQPNRISGGQLCKMGNNIAITVNSAIKNGSLATQESICSALETQMQQHTDDRLQMRMRGWIFAHYGEKMGITMEQRFHHSTRLSIPWNDEKPQAVYVGGSPEHEIAVWEPCGDSWIKNSFPVGNAWCVNYVRVHEHGEAIVGLRHVLEAATSELRIYKKVPASHASDDSTWKNGTPIRIQGDIKSCALTKTKERCAVLVREKNAKNDCIKIYIKNETGYVLESNREIAVGIQDIAFVDDDSTLALHYANRQQTLKIEGLILSPYQSFNPEDKERSFFALIACHLHRNHLKKQQQEQQTVPAVPLLETLKSQEGVAANAAPPADSVENEATSQDESVRKFYESLYDSFKDAEDLIPGTIKFLEERLK